MKDIDKKDYLELRPYEKCLEMGECSLSDAELLSVIIKTGVKGSSSIELSGKILNFSEENSGILGLMQLSITELMQIRGIGRVKAIQIRCIGELSRRIAKATATEKLSFDHPEAIARYYMEDLRHCMQERLVVALLDTRCRLIYDRVLTVGTINASLITPREVFVEALKHNAVAIVILHNHPSGDPTPSSNDLAVTRRIKDSGDLLGIRLIDHIIIGDNRYTSLKEKGIL